jgi:hypothetical protein
VVQTRLSCEPDERMWSKSAGISFSEILPFLVRITLKKEKSLDVGDCVPRTKQELCIVEYNTYIKWVK